MKTRQLIDLENTRRERRWLEKNHPLRQLFWECTLRCNLSCRHCGSDCRKVSVTPDMPLEHFLPVLDDVAAHCNSSQVLVNTVGGEPLVRRKDIIALCKKHNDCAFHAYTNGTLIDDEFAEEVRKVGTLSFSISMS